MGLVSGIVGGIVVGALAGSPLQVSGPAAGLAVIVLEIVEDPTMGIEMLGVMVFVAGLVQIAAGYTNVGQVFRAVSPPVVRAMLSGIGVLIFASMFHVMVDAKGPGGGLANLITIPMLFTGEFNLGPLSGLLHHGGGEHAGPVVGTTNSPALLIGVVSLAILVGWNALKPKLPDWLGTVPAPLLAVIVATAMAWFAGSAVAYVEVPTDLGSFINPPKLSNFARLAEPAILGTTLAIAAIASAESLLCAVAVDKLHDGPRTNFDKELVAQGVGNSVAGLLGGLPVTGVIVRSTANVEAGGETRWSAILHGFWIVITVAALPWALAKIPVAALAAVLVYIGVKLMDFKAAYGIYQRSRADFFVFAVTVTAIVFANLLEGLLIGLALAILKLAWSFSRLEIDVAKNDEKNRIDVDLRGAATFVGLPKLARTLEALDPKAEVHIHLEHLSYIDHACFDLIRDWETQREQQGGTLVLEWDELHDVAEGSEPPKSNGAAAA